MNKEKVSSIIFPILMMVLVLIGIIWGIYEVDKNITEKNQERQAICDEKGITYKPSMSNYCTARSIECFDDCERLDRQMFKFKYPTCYCLDNNKPLKIW